MASFLPAPAGASLGHKKAPLHKCAGALLFFSAHDAGNEDLQTDANEDDAAEDGALPESLVPNFLPMARPASQMKKVTIATMREQTSAMNQPYSEMVKPTDSASMLVATPCMKSAPALSSAASSVSSPLSPR